MCVNKIVLSHLRLEEDKLSDVQVNELHSVSHTFSNTLKTYWKKVKTGRKKNLENKHSDWLDKKFTILYRLCEEQLSKQRHYDFGLRNILSVLRFAGTVLREATKAGGGKTEEYLLASTLTQMNMSKFVMQDKSLFTELIGDIFPMVADQIKRSVHVEEEKQLNIKLEEQNLVKKDEFLLKLI